MKFSTSPQSFRNALARLYAIPGGKGGPLASTVRIETTMDGIEITRRTPEARITVSCEGDIIKQGECVVDYSRITTVISRVDSSAAFEKSKDGKWLKMEGDGTDGKVAIVPEEGESNFDADEAMDGAKTILPAAEFRRAVAMVEPAICVDTARANFIGMNVASAGGRTALLATNGRVGIIAYLSQPIETGGIVPPEAIAAIMNTTKDEGGDISVQMNGRRLVIVSPTMTLGVQLMESNFPNLAMLFDRAETVEKTEITVNKAQILSAIRATSSTGEGELSAIELKSGKKGMMEITGDNKTDASISRRIPCSFVGDSFSFIASSTYLSPAIDCIPENAKGEVVINLHPSIKGATMIHESVKSNIALMSHAEKVSA